MDADEIFCCDPVEIHSKTTRFKRNHRNKNTFRQLKETESSHPVLPLTPGEWICDRCRAKVRERRKLGRNEKPTLAATKTKTSSKSVVCSNPVSKPEHDNRRKRRGEKFYRVQPEWIPELNKKGFHPTAGARACRECREDILDLIRIYCSDPLKRHKQKRQKSFIFNFKRAGEKYVAIAKRLVLELAEDDELCTGCRRKLEKQDRKLELKRDEQTAERLSLMSISDSSSGERVSVGDLSETARERSYHSPSPMEEDDPAWENESESTNKSDDEFLDHQTEIIKLNLLLSTIGLPNVKTADLKTRKAVQSLYKAICDKIEETLTNCSGREIETGGTSCFECSIHMQCLAEAYKQMKSRDDKYLVLTSLPRWVTMTLMMQFFDVSPRMAVNAIKLREKSGMFATPRPKIGHPVSPRTVQLVKEFYLSPEVSRMSPNMADVMKITTVGADGVKRVESVAKQELLGTLDQLYREFRLQHSEVKISRATFRNLKPPQCKWGKVKGFQQTCLCIHHANFDLLMCALGIESDKGNKLESFLCGLNDECLRSECPHCPKWNKLDELLARIDGSEIEFWQWTSVSGQGFDLTKIQMSREEFKKFFKAQLTKFSDHHLVYTKQKAYLKKLRSFESKDESLGVLYVDFAQNYTFVLPEEVQSSYWTNNQVTVFPFVLYYYTSAQSVQHCSFTVVSDCMKHDATSFHIFRHRVITEYIKPMFPNITKIDYVSDGTGVQFKNVKNFANLCHHHRDYGIKATAKFSGTGHGKTACDAKGAIAKQTTRRESLRRKKNFIMTGQQMVDYLVSRAEENGDTNSFYLFISNEYVTKMEAELQLERRYKIYKTIPGTRQMHDVEPLSDSTVRCRKFSSSPEYTEHTFGMCSAEQPNNEKMYKPGDYIAVAYGGEFMVGMIQKEDEHFEDYEINFMRKSSKGLSYMWTDPQKSGWVCSGAILLKLTSPTTANGRTYRFVSTELDNALRKHAQNQ